MSSQFSPLDYYREMRKIKYYYRYIPGTIILGLFMSIGAVTNDKKAMYGVFLFNCSWALDNKYFIPPVPLIMFLLMILVEPTEHLDVICLFGQIMVPLGSFAYCTYMLYMSHKNSSTPELIFYALLTVAQITTMLPENFPGVKFFRPFLRRPEEEIEREKQEVVKKFQKVTEVVDDHNVQNDKTE